MVSAEISSNEDRTDISFGESKGDCSDCMVCKDDKDDVEFVPSLKSVTLGLGSMIYLVRVVRTTEFTSIAQPSRRR